MLKLYYAFGILMAIWIDAANSDPCLYQYELWADEDPTKFYYCDPTTQQAALASCLPEMGFVRNSTVSGCVPWLEWSGNECVKNVDARDITCIGDSFLQPNAGGDPGIFYLCVAEHAVPVQLKCEEGKGFYANNHYLGCFPWPMWKLISGCTGEDV